MKLNVKRELEWRIVSERKTEDLIAKNAIMLIQRNKIWTIISTLLMGKKIKFKCENCPKTYSTCFKMRAHMKICKEIYLWLFFSCTSWIKPVKNSCEIKKLITPIIAYLFWTFIIDQIEYSNCRKKDKLKERQVQFY